MSLRASVVLTASLASFVLARTDLTGCTSTDVSSPAGASIAWYVPGTGELCDFLDCGGGMAPPKTTVPGCPLYSGTATYSPSYLPGYGAMTASAAASTSSSSAVTASSASISSQESWASSSATDSSDAWSSSASQTEVWAQTTALSSVESSAIPKSTLSTSITGITSGPAAVGTGVIPAGSVGGTNGTLASATPRFSSTPSVSVGGAMETARVWMGGAGLLGLGAIVAAL